MREFKEGAIHLLVSTTVIEVGIDVPNASVMLIEHAERFGLSQLHQLRGRVGRGPWKSYCILLTAASSEDAKRRIAALEETNDGFRIAEADLELRGPGDFFGTRQSGLPEFRVADLLRDAPLLEEARQDAVALVQGDPSLVNPEHRALRAQRHQRALADVAAGLKQSIGSSLDPMALEFTTVAAGDSLTITHTPGTAFTTTLVITPAGVATANVSQANVTRVDLGGTPVTNDAWIIRIDGVAYRVVVGQGYEIDGTLTLTLTVADTLAHIAAALAASINAIGPAGITVAVEGNSLLITERNGAEFETAALIALDTDTNGTISAPVSSVATVLTLRGTPVTDDTWHLTVNGFIYNVSVDATTDTLAEIAVKLATLINADDINAPNLIATAVGDIDEAIRELRKSRLEAIAKSIV